MKPSAIAVDDLKPPVTSTGIIGWMRTNLFSSWFNSLLTVGILYFLWKTIPPFVNWAFVNGSWMTSSQECRANTGGACWSIIWANYRFIFFGFYPADEQWRPFLAVFLLLALLVVSRYRRFWSIYLAWAWIIGLFSMGLLMQGGFLGLKSVESSQWGGIPLTMLLSVFGLAAAYPLGVILALGRQAQMPAIRTLSIFYIELIRGVPLISMLFMSSVIFPLFLPEGVTVNKIFRAQVAIILFTAAYIAEVVRGGLQAIPKGQFEAADSIGLNYFQTMRLIILPQALKIVIPPSVSILISAFKDTSLVVIIALYDILKTTQATLANPTWMGFSREAYIFLALIYFLGCYFMSTWSRTLEKELKTDR